MLSEDPAILALQAAGYSFRFSDLVHETSNAMRPAAEVEVDVTLPARSPIAASFAPERGYHRLVKLLREEIQTGDDVFDAAVYISTDTVAATRALLDKPRAREIIQRLVSGGGLVTVSDTTAVIVQVAPNRAAAHLHGDDIAWLIEALAS
jgi:hypothetical protein